MLKGFVILPMLVMLVDFRPVKNVQRACTTGLRFISGCKAVYSLYEFGHRCAFWLRNKALQRQPAGKLVPVPLLDKASQYITANRIKRQVWLHGPLVDNYGARCPMSR